MGLFIDFATSRFMDRVRDTAIWGHAAPRLYNWIIERDRRKAKRRLNMMRPPRHKIDPEIPRITISIAKDFGRYPGGRTIRDGPLNGQLFYEQHLLPALNREDHVTRIVFDDGFNVAASWIDEAFGKLPLYGFDREYLEDHLEIEYDDPLYIMYEVMVWGYIFPEDRNACVQ